MKKTSFLLLVGILTVVLLGAYTGYNFWQKSAIGEDLKRTEKELANYKKTALENDNRNVTQAIAAKKTVEGIKTNLVEWSKVMKDIRKTVPRKQGRDLAEIISYAASAGTGISMNVKTFAGSSGPYLDIAEFIQSFDESKDFFDGFVTSVSSGTDTEGEEVLSFLFTTKYKSENKEDSLQVIR